ncbi:MAG: MarR family transcriptional regulator [Proteobacteria bacterium]|nr:MAG: MarR family transcriptional regulator [Pseudomonadota bacterium]
MASNAQLLEMYSSLRRNISLEATFFLKETGFSLRQFLILRGLGARGPLKMTTLADHCNTDAATVTRAVGQLLEQDLVVKLQCPEDGRVFRAKLTTKGERLLPELHRLHAKLADHCFSPLKATDKKILFQLLNTVVETLESRRQPATAGELA